MIGSFIRQLQYQFRRRVLRRCMLLADGLPLGMAFRFHAPDDVGRRLFKRRTHEPHILERLCALDPGWQDAVCIDAGANLGWYSVLFDRLAGGTGRVLACEPDPGNLALLRDNLALNRARSVEVVPAALSDHTGAATLHRYRDINLGRHSLNRQARHVGGVEVSLRTLDAVLAEHGLAERPIAVLKADVEGHEPELLHGARQGLARCRVVILEHSPMYASPQATRTMVGLLGDAGLQPEAWMDGGWRRLTTPEVLALTEQRDMWWERG